MGQEINFRRQRGGKKRKVKKKKNHLKFEDNKKKLKFEKKKNPRLIRQIIIWAAEIAGACAVAVLLVAFFGHRISNSGDAMTPSIRNGEVVLVDRLVIDMKELSRGQIVAFRPNGNKEVHFYIRRVAGLPGETVQIKEGKLYIDGEELKSYEDLLQTMMTVDCGWEYGNIFRLYGQFNSKAGVIQFSMLETSPSMQQNTEWSEQTL